jgi:hypothetical protein
MCPSTTVGLMTGNNVLLGGDLPRRVCHIRLNTEQSNPASRSGFRHPKLEQWVMDNRKEILTQILIMARAWFRNGCPKADVIPMGTFTSWAETVGGILKFAGCKGFLGNAQKSVAEMDTESNEWAHFLARLKREYPNGFTVTRLVADLIASTDSTFVGLIPEAVGPYIKRFDQHAPSGLGKVLQFRRNRRYFLPSTETDYSDKDQELWLNKVSPKKPTIWEVISTLDPPRKEQ